MHTYMHAEVTPLSKLTASDDSTDNSPKINNNEPTNAKKKKRSAN